MEIAHGQLSGSLAPLKAAAYGNPQGAPDALNRSEMNLLRTQAFLEVMRRQRMGIPGGHLMDLALSEKPSSEGHWPNLTWSDFRPELVWPYIVTHLDIVERALGQSRRLSWPPELSPLRTLKTLALLPALRRQVVPGV